MIKVLLIVLALSLLAIIKFGGATSDTINYTFPAAVPSTTSTPVPTLKPITSFPFTSQAPNGDWSNPFFQDGCEEASVIMFYCAFSQKCPVASGVISPVWAENEITKLSNWEIDTYGSSTDTSAQDTAERLLKTYYKFTNYRVVELKSSEDLKKGIWIFPMDGQALNNPFFTPPGPERHMVLVIGYDSKTNQVITNDAGTRHGRNYRYNLNVFYNAIRDYPTGDHLPIYEISKKGILIGGM